MLRSVSFHNKPYNSKQLSQQHIDSLQLFREHIFFNYLTDHFINFCYEKRMRVKWLNPDQSNDSNSLRINLKFLAGWLFSFQILDTKF